MSDLLHLRPYQQECVDSVEQYFDDSGKRGAVVLPTASGKTVMFSHLAKRYMERYPKRRVLILSHTDELVNQARNKFLQIAPHLNVGIVKGNTREVTAPIISASVQSLRNPKSRADIRGVGLIIADECHHFVAKTFLDVLEHYGSFDDSCPVKTVGFTATLARGDKKKLSDVWEKVVYTKDILWMIRNGYLLDVKGKRVEVPDLDFSSIKKRAGDYAEGELGKALTESLAPELTAKAYIEHASDRSGILFTPTVASAYAMSEAFREQNITCEVVHGNLPINERRNIIRRFDKGDIQVIANCMALTEGFDSPRASCVVIARQTKSAPLYCLDAQTEVLTDRGWSGVDSIDINSCAAEYDEKTGKISWSPILGLVDRPLIDGESFYKLESPTLDIRVTDGHRMIWRSRTSGYKISTAKELSNKKGSYCIPISGMQDAPGVPLSNDELRFLGWFMTDGSLSKRNGSIRISQAEHQPWNKDIISMLDGCGFKYSVYKIDSKTNFNRNSSGISYQISKGYPRATNKDLRGWGELESYISKDFPLTLENISREQLHVLLEAIHLGDGAKQLNQSWTRRSYHISTSNETFADRLQSICVRRGFKCNKSLATYNENPLWTLHIKDTTFRYVGGTSSIDRPILSPDTHIPKERVWCIGTSKGTIVTRRNGKVAILGNCQMVGRALRLYPGQTDALILDVVGASLTHDLRSLIDITDAELCADETLTLADRAEIAEQEEVTVEDTTPVYYGPVEVKDFNPLVRDSKRVWLMTVGGTYFLSAGEAYVFLVPCVGDCGVDQWDVAWCSKPNSIKYPVKTGGYTEHRGVDLQYAFAWGEDVAEEMGGASTEYLSTKDKQWRKSKASPKALQLARIKGLDVHVGMTGAQVSNVIEVDMASRRIDTVTSRITR